jgi:glutamine cyclotransferase
MSRSSAEIVHEYGPFPGGDNVHGVTYDGQHVWFASGDKLIAFDPASGKAVRSIEVAAHARTAFDGQHLYQLGKDRIQKIDPKTGRVLATIPAPGGGGDSGLTWAEGTLWVGQYRDGKIYQVDPQTGAILRTIESDRFVTGVTWSTESSGTPPGKVTRASCGESIPAPEKSWKRSRCRREWACQGSSPMAAIGSSAEGEGAGR